MIDRFGRRIISAVTVVVVVAIGVRIADLLVAPLLPILIVVGTTIFLFDMILRKR